MRKPSIERKILADGEVKGNCHFCGREVDGMSYCFGCGEFICYECMGDNPPTGRHTVEEHKEEVKNGR